MIFINMNISQDLGEFQKTTEPPVPPNPGIIGLFEGNHPFLMATRFRLVKYSDVPKCLAKNGEGKNDKTYGCAWT